MGTTSEMQFDVEAAIADFVKDGGRASLELPPMPAGQRKHVKLIADTYPDLVCESFGIGSDRCIHVFKRAASYEGTGGVSVKNTFIDDWITPAGDDDAVEPVVFRSMPSSLADAPARRSAPGGLPAPTSRLDLSPISEGSPKLSCSDSFGMASVKQVDIAKCRHGEGEGSGGPCSAGGLPTLLKSFQVRNTFIHIDDMSPDERSVQSMPHDMFRQCLQEELNQVQGSDAKLGGLATKMIGGACQDAASGQLKVAGTLTFDRLTLGTLVFIQGLTQNPAFNGQSGIVERLDESTGRYSVKLTTGGPGIPKFAKVKRDNLCVATLPLPSPEFPTCTAAPSGPQAWFGAFADTNATGLKLTALV